jgi:hypothetical protein
MPTRMDASNALCRVRPTGHVSPVHEKVASWATLPGVAGTQQGDTLLLIRRAQLQSRSDSGRIGQCSISSSARCSQPATSCIL